MNRRSFIKYSILASLTCLASAGCSSNSNPQTEQDGMPSFANLSIGEDYKDITAHIKVLTFRTDIMDKLNGYADEFKRLYPSIDVEFVGTDDYEKNAILYLTSGTDWGDVMMIPLGIEKSVAPDYFLALGDSQELGNMYNFTNAWTYDNQVYGLASTGNANGILYNKRVFKDAGITELPKTPSEFIAALQSIKDNTSAIPLYTNYADEWPMSSWDAYMGANATGSADYIQRTLVHASNPFKDFGDQTHPYAVYRILYDAVSLGLTEDDYTTTSESLSYGLLNNGEIGCLIFSSWAVAQAMAAGDHPEDIGFMAFPITVNGKQFVSINGDYSYGINRDSSRDEQIASMLFIKWMIHSSGFSYSEGGLSVAKDGENPDFYNSLDGVELLEDSPALPGEEELFDQINTESGLLFNANGNAKCQDIVEHAFLHDKDFDSIMDDWNLRWSQAQSKFTYVE